MGDLGCFSFFSNKNISAGEGGLISVKNKRLAKKLKYLRSHGMTQLSLDRKLGRTSQYDVVEAGLNYRIDELRSSLAKVQMLKLQKANLERKKYFENYKEILMDLPIRIPFQNLSYSFKAAYHIFPILLPSKTNKAKLIEKLKKNGIQTSIHYPPFWSFSIYKNIFNKNNFPICNEICKRQLTLPLFPNMKKEDIKTVYINLKKLL